MIQTLSTCLVLWVVTANISDKELKRMAFFRSRSWILILSLVHSKSQPVLVHCSQSVSGMSGNETKKMKKDLQATDSNAPVSLGKMFIYFNIIYIIEKNACLCASLIMAEGGGEEWRRDTPCCQVSSASRDGGSLLMMP